MWRDWAGIRRLHLAEGLTIKEIARRLGISKNTVKAMLPADAPPKYLRGRRSAVDGFEPEIRGLSQEFRSATMTRSTATWTSWSRPTSLVPRRRECPAPPRRR